MTQPAVVHLVPHTHWDREWYEPFQSFRMRLVELIDGVLDQLDGDPRFAFTLDGQLATVDDYLEIRPAAEERIRRHVATGRLAIGPWQILMDEFLVSGENMVRNLERGWRRAEELGRPMAAGYLPDMFGHVAQMPQMLRRAGIGRAAVWRGVPSAIGSHAFRWNAPDGSTVDAEYLVGGYGNGASLLAIPDRLPAKLAVFDEAMRPYFGDDPLLAMYGTDHAVPIPGLVELVERMNAAQQAYRVRIDTLADYLAETDAGATRDESWTGELRSGARANLLMGVTSTRIEIKAACGRAERLLERYAEPLQALHGDGWPADYLRLAWDRVIANSAHDSICGCSVDPVADQVLVRFYEAQQIADGLTRRVARHVARNAPRDAAVVMNPSPHERSGLVELDLRVPDEWEAVSLVLPHGARLATQEVARSTPLLLSTEVRGGDVPAELARRMHGRELFGRFLNRIETGVVDGRRHATFHVDVEPEPATLDMEQLRRELEIAVQAAPDEPWTFWIRALPRRRVVAMVPAPPLGWTTATPVRGSQDASQPNPVTATGRRLGNGLVEVEVADDGTFTLAAGAVRIEGAGRLVDGGDVGDSYNYAPPSLDRLVEAPESVSVDVLAAGPVRGVLAVERNYRWPLELGVDRATRSDRSAEVSVRTELELRADEPFLRVAVSFDNPALDHRVRFHVPLPRAADGSAAEGQFAVVERALEAEGGYGELPLPTFPARGFVDAGGVAVLLDHVTEYEVIDGRELALTVLRSTGMISVNTHPYRTDPAGPEIAIPGAQGRGPRRLSFALLPHPGSWVDDRVLAAMERYQHDFVAARGSAVSPSAGAPPSQAGLQVAGDGVVLSALRRRGEWLELRLVCEVPHSVEAVVRGQFDEAREADLLGRPGADRPVADGAITVALGPWEIRTLHLR